MPVRTASRHDCRRRHRAHHRRRRWRGHGRRDAEARDRASCDVQARDRRPWRATISPTSPRSAFAARRCPRSAPWRGSRSQAARRRRPLTSSRVEGGAMRGPEARRLPRERAKRHARRSARSLLRDARAAEIPEIAARRIARRHRRRRSGSPWRAPMSPSCSPMRAASCSRLPPRRRLFEGSLERLAKLMGRDFADNAAPIEAAREACAPLGFRRASDLQPRQRAGAVPVRQRPRRCATVCCWARSRAPTPTTSRATAIRR